ncbi:EAL domain-containing protein [Ideonella sp. B7]|uniref:putative bifunctional diguanylate cyclase/phosphodiesterase n=1 Tax=Ideonella benzenivorans TaxID=2831643 RepID=UPI001CED7C79|nr:GGDEF domain-containing phosphodiesterase [Ideonella benzenivorans]MCA6215814.1 EAL domain-containing protein [Ideonella benzenivorans]
MPDHPHPSPPNDARPPQDLKSWRAQVLRDLLSPLQWVAWLVALPSGALAWNRGLWPIVVLNVLAPAFITGLGHAPSLRHDLRATSLLVVLQGVGTALLWWVGLVGQAYLMAVPVLAVLLLGMRAAWLALAANVFTWLLLGLAAHAGLGALDRSLAGDGVFGVMAVNALVADGLMVFAAGALLYGLHNVLDAHRRSESTLRASEANLRQLTAQVPGVIFRLTQREGQRQFTYVSPGVQTLYGLSPEEVIADPQALEQHRHPDDRANLEALILASRAQGRPIATAFRIVARDGQVKWVELTASAPEPAEQGWVRTGLITDITLRKEAETVIWQQAHFDALTGLPNRNMLLQQLQQDLDQPLHEEAPLALMLLDLDRFKEVNDTLGHAHGDLLLVETARRLRQCVRQTDTVARMGGDEFTVLLRPQGSSPRADELARRILARLSEPFSLGNERVHVTASIGIALAPAHAQTVEDLLKHADQALYLAKDGGRNAYRYFTPALQEAAQTRMRLANDLHDALTRHEFEVHYQPIVHLATGAVRKAEALLRWHHPVRGPVSPALFVPIAESTGLIREIGEWVFQQALHQVVRWRAEHDPRFNVSVNKSPVQFRSHGHGIPTWAEALQSQHLPGNCVTVEITEGLLLEATPQVSTQLTQMKAAGMGLAMDDFGTGYSSLSYLHRYPIDQLKIDQAFVRDLGPGSPTLALCKAIIRMAHELGMQVVAEGVETLTQRDLLLQAGCDFGQGYLFARPMPAEAMDAWLAERRAIPLNNT